MLAALMLATSYVGTVMAGKGQEKLDFLLHLEGLPTGVFDRQWEAGKTTHSRGMGFAILGDFYVQIGTGGTVESITKDYLEYEASLEVNNFPEKGWFKINVWETISVYSSDTTHDENTLRGTIELLSLGGNSAGNGARATGFGTGEFEGAKFEARTVGFLIGNPDPPYYMLALDRTGTVMGWPT